MRHIGGVLISQVASILEEQRYPSQPFNYDPAQFFQRRDVFGLTEGFQYYCRKDIIVTEGFQYHFVRKAESITEIPAYRSLKISTGFSPPNESWTDCRSDFTETEICALIAYLITQEEKGLKVFGRSNIFHGRVSSASVIRMTRPLRWRVRDLSGHRFSILPHQLFVPVAD